MSYSPILAPVVALVAWSLVMMAWMFATRFPAMRGAGINLGKVVGARGAALDGVVADQVQWKAHNYNHLMEQPTLFYALALTLAMMDQGDGINLWLAWGYVVLRILHRLIQAITNVVRTRFLAFALASLCLVGLAIHAGARIVHDLL